MQFSAWQGRATAYGITYQYAPAEMRSGHCCLGCARLWVWKVIMLRHKIILICGLTAFALCGLWPPWLEIDYRGHAVVAGDHHFIFGPPEYEARLDAQRLLVQWLCVGALSGIAWLLATPKKKTNSTSLGEVAKTKTQSAGNSIEAKPFREVAAAEHVGTDNAPTRKYFLAKLWVWGTAACLFTTVCLISVYKGWRGLTDLWDMSTKEKWISQNTDYGALPVALFFGAAAVYAWIHLCSLWKRRTAP